MSVGLRASPCRLALLGALLLGPLPGAGAQTPSPPDLSAAPVQQNGDATHAVKAGVTIRLDPALGDALAPLKEQLARYPFVTVGEPADYELTTRAEFPQTLLLVNVAEPEEEWRLTFDGADPTTYRRPQTRDVGNLLLRDYRAELDKLLRQIGKARALAALATPDGPEQPLLCFKPEMAEDGEPGCFGQDGAPLGRSDGQAPPLLFPESRLSLSVRNRASLPRYIYLFAVGPDDGIRAIPLQGSALTAPGSETDAIGALPLNLNGAHALVAIASAQPLSAAMLDPSGFSGMASEHCTGALAAALCGFSPAAQTMLQGPDWSANVVRLAVLPSRTQPIGGGVPVMAFMAPWMAQIYSTIPYKADEIADDDALPPGKRQYLSQRSVAERNHRCGGTLIEPGLILTAAHCVAKGDFAGDGVVQILKARRVRLGTHGLGWGGTTYAIDAVAVHSGYRSGGQLDDIALLRVKPDRGTYAGMTGITPATLQQASRLVGTGSAIGGVPVAAYGWGFTRPVAPRASALIDTSGALQHNPDILQMGQLESLKWKTCRERVGSVLGEGMLCAVPRTNARTGVAMHNVFSCVGDSGGPLMRSAGGKDILVGIASWSMGCGYANFPSVYTDVGKYAGWIAAARSSLRANSVVRVNAAGQATLVQPPRR